MDKRTVATRSVVAATAFMAMQAVLAAVWRRGLLPDTYEGREFYDATEPTLALVVGGLATYFLTGLIVSFLYGHFSAVTDGGVSTTRYFFLMGALYWVLHDASYVSRHEVDGVALYLGLEGILAIAVFTGAALVIPRVFSASTVRGRELVDA